MVHNLKVDPKYFHQLRNLSKSYEIRKNDRDYHVGDILLLQCKISPLPLRFIVMSMLTHEEFPEGLKEGYVILSLRIPSV